MPEKPTWEQIEQDRDKPVKLPLDPEEAVRGLLAVDPEEEPAEPSGSSDLPPRGRG